MSLTDIVNFSVPAPFRRFFEAIYRDEKKRLRDRRILATVAVTLACVLYWLFVQHWFPNKNIVDKLVNIARTPEFEIYTGGPGGFYIEIGEYLEQESSRTSEPFRIKAIESRGSLENIRKVSTHGGSLGLAQQNVLDLPQFSGAAVQRVTPLYMESMHLIYNVEAYEDSLNGLEGASSQAPAPPAPQPPPALSLGRYSGTELRHFLQNARINIGGPTGGTFLLASATLDLCGITPRELTGYGYATAFEELTNGKVDAVFATARAPLPEIERLLLNPELALVSIDPGIITELSRALGSSLHGAALSSRYPAYGKRAPQVTTYGTYATLIASRDMPDPVIRWIAQRLDVLPPSRVGASRVNGPVLGYPFVDDVESTRRSYFGDFLESVVLCLIFMGIAIGAILTFLVWAVSYEKHAQHYRVLSDLYSRLPANKQLLPESPDPLEPLVPAPDLRPDDQNGAEIIDALVRGMSGLLDQAARIRSDAETGGITLVHQRHLLDQVVAIKRLFQDNLAQRLVRALATGDAVITQAGLLNYFTAGYVRRDQFKDLSRRLRKRPGQDAV